MLVCWCGWVMIGRCVFMDRNIHIFRDIRDTNGHTWPSCLLDEKTYTRHQEREKERHTGWAHAPYGGVVDGAEVVAVDPEDDSGMNQVGAVLF